jgi:hypothetical protein
MRPVAKAGLVAVGYLAALAIAWLVSASYLAVTSGSDLRGQGGMAAFGDSLLFLGVFGLAAIPATGATLFFLRPHPAFWLTLSIASLAAASTGAVAALMHDAPAFAVLRIFVAPLFAMLWLLSGLFAPNRSARLSLMAAGAIEVAVFAYVVFGWFHPLHA